MTEYIVQVDENGTECWHNKNGELHREGDLPAFTQANGFKAYYLNNRLTREAGPACIWPNGREEYWIDDVELTKEQFESRGKPKHEGTVVIMDGIEYELKAKNETSILMKNGSCIKVIKTDGEKIIGKNEEEEKR